MVETIICKILQNGKKSYTIIDKKSDINIGDQVSIRKVPSLLNNSNKIYNKIVGKKTTRKGTTYSKMVYLPKEMNPIKDEYVEISLEFANTIVNINKELLLEVYKENGVDYIV